MSQKTKQGRMVVVHIFNPRTQEAESRQISEFKASLVYRGSSRTARATQRNPVLKKPKNKTTTTKKPNNPKTKKQKNKKNKNKNKTNLLNK